MSMEPKIIDHPGAGKLREMTLEEYMSPLSRDHLAWKQLDEIRAQALKAVELSTQLMQANEKIMELQNKLLAAAQPLTYPYPATTAIPNPGFPPNIYTADPGLIAVGMDRSDEPKVFKKGPFKKIPCPNCGKLLSTFPGPWTSHQKQKHPDNQAPCPTES